MRHWLFPSIWALIILILSIMPGEQLPAVGWLAGADKWAHAFVYGVLAILLLAALPAGSMTRTSRLLLAGSIAAIYGWTMEIIQYQFFPGRFFEWADLVANIFGILVALLLKRIIFNQY